MMILPNHPRLRLALKVLLTVTAPLWFIPAIVVCLCAAIVWDLYADISRMIDGDSHGRGGGR